METLPTPAPIPAPRTETQAEIQFRKEQREAAIRLKKMMDDI